MTSEGSIMCQMWTIRNKQKYILTYNIFAYFVFLYEKKSNRPHLAHDTTRFVHPC